MPEILEVALVKTKDGKWRQVTYAEVRYDGWLFYERKAGGMIYKLAPPHNWKRSEETKKIKSKPKKKKGR